MSRFYDADKGKEHKRWYSLKAWKDRRHDQLTREPLCAFCLGMGHVTPATVADHVVPHRGDYDLFWFGELQSLCATHHNAAKQQIESTGYSTAADIYGYPLDPNHPQNRPR